MSKRERESQLRGGVARAGTGNGGRRRRPAGSHLLPLPLAAQVAHPVGVGLLLLLHHLLQVLQRQQRLLQRRDRLGMTTTGQIRGESVSVRVCQGTCVCVCQGTCVSRQVTVCVREVARA